MRRAMATAPLGDDVFGDDPTVNQLEAVAAARLGKEAAGFVPRGDMGNGAGRGVMSPAKIEAAVRPTNDFHQPITAAVTFEDTHNRHGGVVWPLEELRAASQAARGHGLRVHLDGARIFNASVAAGTDVADIAACGDTVTFCLSKGLGCPAGSVFCGSAESVEQARRWRKRLGGAMRQAGVIAATGLIALKTMVDRLAEDHANAQTLAEGLAELPGVRCDLSRVQTNLVFFDLERMTGAEFEG